MLRRAREDNTDGYELLLEILTTYIIVCLEFGYTCLCDAVGGLFEHRQNPLEDQEVSCFVMFCSLLVSGSTSGAGWHGRILYLRPIL